MKSTNMKQLKDYKGTDTLISFRDSKEYLLFMPLLLEIYPGWRIDHADAFNDHKNYVCMEDTITQYTENRIIIPASHFLQQVEAQVINNYEIF